MDEIAYYIENLKSEDFSTRRQAAQMLGEFGDARGVKPLIAVLGDDAWQVRNTVVEALIKIRDKHSIRPLLECLRDEDPAIRNAAMSVLNEMKEDVVPPLTDLLLNDASEDVRIFCANTLGHGRHPQGVPGLLKALGDTDENVRYAAVEALGLIGSPEAVEPLIVALSTESVWSRFPIVVALGSIGDERACPILIELLGDEILRYPAIIALGRIGDIAGFDAVLDIAHVEKTATVLKACVIALVAIERRTAYFSTVEREGYFYGKVIEKLKHLSSPHLVDVLIEMAQSEDGDEVSSALNLLRYVRGELPLEKIFYLLTDERWEEEVRDIIVRQGSSCLPAVMRGLDNPAKEIQSALIRVLGILGSPDDAHQLVKYLESPAPEIVCDTLKTIGMLNAADYFDRMATFLGSENEEIRNAAVGGITLLGKRKLFNRVHDLTRSENRHVRRGAYRIIGFIPSEDSMATLMGGLADESAEVRAGVIQSLGYLGMRSLDLMQGDDYFEAVCGMLLDEDTNVKIETVLALSRINHPGTHEFLVRMLGVREPDLQRFAVRAMGRCRILSAVPKLMEMFRQEESTETRIFICIALGQIGSPDAVQLLMEALDDPASEVVEEAITALSLTAGTSVADDLLPYLDSESWLIAGAVLNAVAAMNVVSAVPAVVAFIGKLRNTDDNSFLLGRAIGALGKTGSSGESGLLVSLLEDSTCMYETFEALRDIWYRHGTSYDVPSISNATARRLACAIYAQLDASAAHERLTPLLDDPYPSVRRIAAVILRQSGRPVCVDAVKEAGTRDTDPWVRQVAGNNT